MPWWVWTLWTVSAALSIAAVAILYLALFHDRPRGRRRCPRCWYDMAGNPGAACPECGRRTARERHFRRTRRRWNVALAGLAVALLAWWAAAAPRAIAGGAWWMALPRPVLALSLQFYDDDEDRRLRWLCEQARGKREQLWKFERWMAAKRCAIILRKPPGPPSPTVPALSLTASTRSKSPVFDHEDTALRLLAFLGPDGGPAVPILIDLCQKHAPMYRRDIIDLLGRMGPAAAPAVPLLATALQAQGISGTAMDSLCNLGHVARPALPQLRIRLLAHNDTGTLVKGAILLRRLEGDQEALAFYRRMLAGEQSAGRLAAIRAAGAMKEPGLALLPEILDSIIQPLNPTGPDGVRALESFGPRAADRLIAFLAHHDPALVAAAAQALGAIRHESAAAAITRLVAHDSREVRVAALKSLYALGDVGTSFVPDLKARLRLELGSNYNTPLP